MSIGHTTAHIPGNATAYPRIEATVQQHGYITMQQRIDAGIEVMLQRRQGNSLVMLQRKH